MLSRKRRFVVVPPRTPNRCLRPSDNALDVDVGHDRVAFAPFDRHPQRGRGRARMDHSPCPSPNRRTVSKSKSTVLLSQNRAGSATAGDRPAPWAAVEKLTATAAERDCRHPAAEEDLVDSPRMSFPGSDRRPSLRSATTRRYPRKLEIERMSFPSPSRAISGSPLESRRRTLCKADSHAARAGSECRGAVQ
jgi:hypothetical protein